VSDDDAHRFPGMEGVEYCPVSIAAKLIGDRWTLLIVRELMAGASRFNEIHRGLPGLSRSLLSGRLRSLVRQGLVEHRGGAAARSYELTAAGADLREVILALGTWTVRWRFPPPTASNADSALLLWRMCQGVNPARLPPHRVTVEFVFTDAEPSSGWLVLDGAHSSLCMEPPGHQADLVARGSVPAWLAVWFGHRTYAEAVAAGALVLDGQAHLVSQLPHWFDTGPFTGAIVAQRPSENGRK
jgi:DNA-binding HxlR family transcriptional regulator